MIHFWIRKSLLSISSSRFFSSQIWSKATVQTMRFSLKDFFSKCHQICSKLLLKKSLMENFIFFCSEQCKRVGSQMNSLLLNWPYFLLFDIEKRSWVMTFYVISSNTKLHGLSKLQLEWINSIKLKYVVNRSMQRKGPKHAIYMSCKFNPKKANLRRTTIPIAQKITHQMVQAL